MPLHEQGYLGSYGEYWSEQHRQKHADLYGCLGAVNRVCHDYLKELQINVEDGKQILTTALLTRSLTCFQSVLVLSERGFADDVRSSNRILLEIQFRLAAIAKVEDAFKRIILDAEVKRKKRLENIKTGKIPPSPEVVNVDLDAELSKCEATIAKSSAVELTVKQLSEMGGLKTSYYTVYPLLCDAVHVSAADLETFVEFDENHKVVGFNYGPHDRELIPYVLLAASLQLGNLAITDSVLRRGLPSRFQSVSDQVSEQWKALSDPFKQRG